MTRRRISVASACVALAVTSPSRSAAAEEAQQPKRAGFAIAAGGQARALWGIPIVGPEGQLTIRPPSHDDDVGGYVTLAFAYGLTPSSRPVLLPRIGAGAEWRPVDFVGLGFGGRFSYVFFKRATRSASYVYAPALGLEVSATIDLVPIGDEARLFVVATPFFDVSMQATHYSGRDHAVFVPMYGGTAALGVRWGAVDVRRDR